MPGTGATVERSRRGHGMEFPSGDFCRDGSSSGLCRGLSDPALPLQPLLGGVPCSPSLAHSSSVYRAVHIYHRYHLQVHMSYPGREIFPIPASPSALPMPAPTGTGSQTNPTTEVILLYLYSLSSRQHRRKKNFLCNFCQPLQTK